MSSEEIESLARKLKGKTSKSMNSTVILVDPARVLDACLSVASFEGFYHLTTITAVDIWEDIELTYHFWKGRSFVSVRTKVSKKKPEIQSIAASLPSAVLYEAEIRDLFGVTFVGNPYTGKRLLLPDDYPDDLPPPLRAEADPETIRKRMKLE